MMTITIMIPDEVAQQYFNASEKLREDLQHQNVPDANELMSFVLAGFSAQEIATQFEYALLNVTGKSVAERD